MLWELLNMNFHTHFTPYSICTLAGAILCLLVLLWLYYKKSENVNGNDLFWTGVATCVGVFLGAHIVFFFTKFPYFLNSLSINPAMDVGDFLYRIFTYSTGMVYYGGVLGGLLSIHIATRVRKVPRRPYLNLMIIVFPLFHCIGRIGCALSGCCYGIEYYGPFAIQYTSDVITEGVNDHIADFPRFPVQPLESLIELILFVVLLLLYLKKKNSISLTPIYLLPYAVCRFLDEFLRGDDYRGIWGPFSTSQWIALIVIVVTVIYLIVGWLRKSHAGPTSEGQ